MKRLTEEGWREIDFPSSRSAAFLRQRQIEREVRRHLRARRFKREIVPIIVCLAGSLLTLGWLAWTIWG